MWANVILTWYGVIHQVGIADVRTILENVKDDAISGAIVVVQAGMTPSAKKAINDAHQTIW